MIAKERLVMEVAFGKAQSNAGLSPQTNWNME
jgi:hypothetical protein